MMRVKAVTFLVLLIASMVAVPAFATDFGINITIWDKMGSGSDWHGTQEDQEVEPGDTPGQVWDLEGFFLKNGKLTMVGGFDFKNGVSGYSFKSGDIFIDTNGDAKYGPVIPDSTLNGIVKNTFGYEYVIDLDFSNLTYNVYQLGADSYTSTVWYANPINAFSNPWRYSSGGTSVGSGNIDYLFGLNNADTGFLGGTHYAATVDLGFLPQGTTFTSHFTMECGNDDLMGHGTTPVPEPGTMVLLGSGLVGLAGWGRKKFRK